VFESQQKKTDITVLMNSSKQLLLTNTDVNTVVNYILT